MHFSLLCRKNAFPIKHYWIGANYSLEKKTTMFVMWKRASALQTPQKV